jgi:hypothetical protein
MAIDDFKSGRVVGHLHVAAAAVTMTCHLVLIMLLLLLLLHALLSPAAPFQLCAKALLPSLR